MALDPSKTCGNCMPQTEIYSQFYPEWANPYDVEKSRKAGLNPDDKSNKKWQVCPKAEITRDQCPSDLWNELGCYCNARDQCAIACRDGQVIDPRTGCTCREVDELNAELYPEWASRLEIA